MIVKKTNIFTEELRNLKNFYDNQPQDWNVSGLCLVRMEIEEAFRDTLKESRMLKGFLKRTEFIAAGAARRTLRIYGTKIENLGNVAKSIEDHPRDKRGLKHIASCVKIHTQGKVRIKDVPDKYKNDHLEIRYWQEEGKNNWDGIAHMLTSLGGTKIQKQTTMGNIGYGSVAIDHTLAERIVQHALVYDVGVVARLVLS